MAENDEESELVAEFGRVLRMATGSGMQIAEARSRRSQVSAAEQAAERDRVFRTEAGVAALVNRELYNPEFWRTANTSSIADRVTVAAHLAGGHAEARNGWMHAADVLRHDFGLNLELMNKDHPTSLTDRDAALRDALDDHFARRQLDAEQDQALAPDTGQEQDTTKDTEQDNQAPTATTEGRAAGQAASATAERDTEGTVADGAADPAPADRHGVEAPRDRPDATAGEQAGGRMPRNNVRITEDQWARIEQHANAPELALVRVRQAAGFARPTEERIGPAPAAGKPVKPQAGPGRGRSQEAGTSR
jgi:hypothetical protein